MGRSRTWVITAVLIGLAAPPAHADPRDDARRHYNTLYNTWEPIRQASVLVVQ
jgi:hypothetical protein